jgi:hypothetical protein
MDQRFVGDGQRLESLGAEVVPLSSDIVVAHDHQPSLLARHGVFDGETFVAAIASMWKKGGEESKAQPKAVSELLCRELGSVESVRRD